MVMVVTITSSSVRSLCSLNISGSLHLLSPNEGHQGPAPPYPPIVNQGLLFPGCIMYRTVNWIGRVMLDG